MRTRIVRIGNSQGVRIPKPLLEETGLAGEVEIEAHDDTLVIRGAHPPRSGWDAAFAGHGGGRGRHAPRRGHAPRLDLGRGGMGVVIRRFEVHLVDLGPTVGTEIRKTRPCLVVSPDEMNRHLRTRIVAPMTTRGRDYPTRVRCRFKGKAGQIVLDQIRTVDAGRLVKKLGSIDKTAADAVLTILGEMFAP